VGPAASLHPFVIATSVTIAMAAALSNFTYRLFAPNTDKILKRRCGKSLVFLILRTGTLIPLMLIHNAYQYGVFRGSGGGYAT